MGHTLNDTQQLAAGLAQIGAFLRGNQWRATEAIRLTPTQLGVLTLLKRRGPNRVMKLAKLLGVTQATTSDVISALQKKGLVQKTPDPSDGRAALIALTQAGNEVASQQDTYPEELIAALTTLSREERDALQRALSKIIRELQNLGAIEPQRLCTTCRFFRPYAHRDAARPHHCAFVDAVFGDAALRVDCSDHVEADDAQQGRQWRRFLGAPSAP